MFPEKMYVMRQRRCVEAMQSMILHEFRRNYSQISEPFKAFRQKYGWRYILPSFSIYQVEKGGVRLVTI